MQRSRLLALVFPLVAAPSAPAQSHAPDSARIVTVDIERFWTAFDRSGAGAEASVFDSLYLGPGSPGLKAFTRSRIGGAEELAAAVRAHRSYYASIRETTRGIAALEPTIRRAFRAFEALYPEAVFPDVYVVVGRMNSAGTTAPSGLLIGAEFFGRTEHTPLEELNAWERAVVRPVGALPHIVAHELVHVQQRKSDPPYTLLALATAEGVAEFLAELMSGDHGNGHIHAWAAPREAELWREFERAKDGEEIDDWLYNGARSRDRPADLGYWIGYRIARAYYEGASDRAQAIRDMLTIEDYTAFLRKSGYAERFRD